MSSRGIADGRILQSIHAKEAPVAEKHIPSTERHENTAVPPTRRDLPALA